MWLNVDRKLFLWIESSPLLSLAENLFFKKKLCFI